MLVLKNSQQSTNKDTENYQHLSQIIFLSLTHMHTHFKKKNLDLWIVYKRFSIWKKKKQWKSQ